MENATSVEEGLSLKVLQSHIIKTIIACLVVAVLSAFTTAYGFYYHTNSSVTELINNKMEVKQDIKHLNESVSAIQMTVSNGSIYTSENIDKIKEIEEHLSKIDDKEDEMLKLLYDIKNNRK